jgi:DNA-directed RNA polymerase specialized sigma24 family protein
LATAVNTVELTSALSDLRAVTEADPSLEVGAEQCLAELDRALKELGPKVQATFLLHRRDGMSIDEIAQTLRISRPMAKKYIVRALVHFRKRLKETE